MADKKKATDTTAIRNSGKKRVAHKAKPKTELPTTDLTVKEARIQDALQKETAKKEMLKKAKASSRSKKTRTEQKPKKEALHPLHIIPLGGLNEIGKNMTAYELDEEIIVVDCGLAFPDDNMYGVDMVIPDISYLLERKDHIRGLFITHAHEDHIGSIPYILKQINIPIFCTELTAGLIKLKLEEHHLLKETKITTVSAGQWVQLGVFNVEFIHINHSIADSVAFAIHTKLGTVVHTGDFKIDSTPIDGQMMDLSRFGELGRNGVLALLADSTNAEREGYSMSERLVGKAFQRQFEGCKQRIIVTTFASNVHRIQQVLDAAAACGRKVAVTGRSMENVMRVSVDLGYMKPPKNTIVELEQLSSLPPHKQVIITTGSQGEEMSALYRMAFATHKQVEIRAGDRIILSASSIPGNEKTISRVINELMRRGADVVYNRQDMLHVSGHACQEELKILHALVQPKFFIPVHGEQRHLRAHAKLAEEMGMHPNNILRADNGSLIELTQKSAKIVGTVPVGQVLVDGSGVGDVGSTVIRDRKKMAEEGMIVLMVNINQYDGTVYGSPELVTRGFIYIKENEELLEQIKENIIAVTETVCARHKKIDTGEVRSALKTAVSNQIYSLTHRNPMVIPVVTLM